MLTTVSRGEGVLVDLALGERRQQRVDVPLFVETVVQQPLVVAQIELAGEGGRARNQKR